MTRKKSGYHHDDDNIPYMTDNMKRAMDEQRPEGLPIEQLVSPAGLDQIEKAQLDRARPVHAEQLVPITKADAAARTAFDGQHLPKAPSTRRVIPAPFQREQIVVGAAHGHGKTWQTVHPDQVREGDIIPGIGLVTAVEEIIQRQDLATSKGIESVAVGLAWAVQGAGGNAGIWDEGQYVEVFRESDERAAVQQDVSWDHPG